jgi:hypothetical protein
VACLSHEGVLTAQQKILVQSNFSDKKHHEASWDIIDMTTSKDYMRPAYR